MLDFKNKVISAPMVRISHLPFRLLALKYGADIIYTDEIIDYKLVGCKRYVNHALGTVDFINNEDHVVFRTCPEEKPKLVLQFATNCPDRALRAAKLVENDVSGIDINMGCPKSFSCKGGMGAALLETPEKIKKILTNLVENLSISVTCKIRILPSLESTIELVKMIESTNVNAIAIHGRTREERSSTPNHTDYIKKITEIVKKVPIIANGESGNINYYSDIEEFRRKSGASSVMIARSAMHNCSIFSKEGLIDQNQIISEYLDLALRYENHFSSSKYCIARMMENVENWKEGKAFLSVSTMQEAFEVWNKKADYDRIIEELRIRREEQLKIIANKLNQQSNGTQNDAINDRLSLKRKLIELIKDEEDADEIQCLKFVRKLFVDTTKLPKTIMSNFATKNQCKISYRTVQKDKRFYCVCECDGIKYLSSFLEKNKKWAEQCAALVACSKLKLIDDHLIKQSMVAESTLAIE